MYTTKDRKHKKIAALFILILLCTITLWGGISVPTAFAASDTEYSNVLDDLSKDESFSASYYPVVLDDYSLQVIQIAESVDNELFVYVYQPSGQKKNLCASSINISTTVNDEISYYNYKLRLINSNGVFYKYLVEDFTVKTEPTRYYAISSIYRPFDETIDKQADHGNEITEINYAVAKQYCFSMINGKPYVQVVDIETIIVTDKFVGFVRYKDGFQLYVGACDSHFVAFNTDKPMDKLLEADVYFTTQAYTWQFVPFLGESEEFGEKKDNYAYLKYTDKVEHTGDGLFAGTYKWDRIETVEQFIAENNTFQNVYSGAILDVNVANEITEEGKAALRGKKWILRFAETEYSLMSGGNGVTTKMSTLVGDVTILRLKFETDGITYNLGTIDNKQSGSDKPINKEEIQVGLSDMGKLILLILAIIILLVILMPVLPYIVKAVVWIVMLPFKAIAGIVNAIKKRKTDSSSKPSKKQKPVKMPHAKDTQQAVGDKKEKAPKYKRNTGK